MNISGFVAKRVVFHCLGEARIRKVAFPREIVFMPPTSLPSLFTKGCKQSFLPETAVKLVLIIHLNFNHQSNCQMIYSRDENFLKSFHIILLHFRFVTRKNPRSERNRISRHKKSCFLAVSARFVMLLAP